MGLPGTTDSSVYEGVKDVLQRHPAVTSVTYEPDSIVKQYLCARVDPDRVVPPTGPESPTLDVEWRFVDGEPYYRIHYADPNRGSIAAGIATTITRISDQCTSSLSTHDGTRVTTSALSSRKRFQPRFSGPLWIDCSRSESRLC